MFAPKKPQPTIFFIFLFIGCLLQCGLASASPSVTLSKKTGPPTSKILVSGRGFEPNEGVDIFFDTKDEAVAIADGAGSFSQIAIPAPASALPGTHWVSVVERSGHNHAQVRFDVHANWREFHRRNMERMNPFENVLNVHNVGRLQLKWSYIFGNASCSPTPSPAVAQGALYMGACESTLYAFDAQTGANLWANGNYGGFGTSPAIANGILYVGSSNNSVYALNPLTGSEIWTYATHAFVDSSPVVANGVVYVASEESGSALYALNASTGALLWSYSAGNSFWSSPAVANGVVYVGSSGGTYALNASTGALLWSGPGNTSNSSPALADGILYVGTVSHVVYALKAQSGATVWSYTTSGPVASSPAVAKGVVYVGSGDDLYALDARTGNKLWSYATGGSVQSSPAVANGVVYFGSEDDNIYALDASTGTKLWGYSAGFGFPVDSSPVVVNGVVYVGTDGYIVYAFGLPDGDETKQDAASKRPALKTLHPDLHLKSAPVGRNTTWR